MLSKPGDRIHPEPIVVLSDSNMPGMEGPTVRAANLDAKDAPFCY
jgi:hypothetical protein